MLQTTISSPWFETAHLARRCSERRIGANAVARGLDLADLRRPLEDGKIRLGFSRRVIRRVQRDPALAPRARFFARLVLIVSEDGAVITGWLGRRRQCRPAIRRDDAEGWDEE